MKFQNITDREKIDQLLKHIHTTDPIVGEVEQITLYDTNIALLRIGKRLKIGRLRKEEDGEENQN